MAQSQDDVRGAAAYMSGVLQSVYDEGNLLDGTKENVNEKLQAAGLDHVEIE